ncbi:MAG: AMP-binding protein [Geminicoccaceae bacterium]
MDQAAARTSSQDTTATLLRANASAYGDDIAYREKDLGIWHTYSWAETLDVVRGLALGLKELGLERGDVVALLGRNRPNWVFGELAAQALGCKTIGIYQDALAQEVAYLAGFAGATFALVEDEEQVDKFLEIKGDLPALRKVVFHDPRGMRKHADNPLLAGYGDVLARGRELHRTMPNAFDHEIDAGSPDDVCILCTTSGTTANPKLAQLSHRAVLDHARAFLRTEPRDPSDEYVSLLQLPWIVEQVYVVFMGLLTRYRVSFAESDDTAMSDLREIAPTHVMFAPRVWEQIAADIRSRILDADRWSRRSFDNAVAGALAALDRGESPSWWHRFVMDTLRDRLGFTRVKAAATGGAALGPETFRFFLAMGVPLKQLYGQTEACGAYTLQRPEDGLDYDSSGQPFDNTELKIVGADEQGVGEVHVRHTGMMTSYFGNDEATAEIFDDEGWLATGDAGFLDERNRLTIIDRVKDIATTQAGVRFSPQFIENKLKFSPYIGECVVLGDRRPFLSAILCIRFSMVSKWAEAHNIAFTGYTNLSANASTYELLQGEVMKVNESLPEAQRLRRFLLLYKELDADDGELTRTRKVRRGVIDERYAELIEAIYAGETTYHVDAEVTFEDGRKGRVQADVEIRDLPSGDAAMPVAAE